MTFMKFGTYESRPRYYLTVEGKTMDSKSYKSIGSPSIKGDMKDDLEIYFTQNMVVKYSASGTIAPFENDVLWSIDEVLIPSFEYEIYSHQDEDYDWRRRFSSYNEDTYAQVPDVRESSIIDFEIEVQADTEDPSTWVFRVVDLSY